MGGELRYNMVGDVLIGIIHKAQGGRNFCSGWHRLDLHLLRSQGEEVRELDEELRDD